MTNLILLFQTESQKASLQHRLVEQSKTVLCLHVGNNVLTGKNCFCYDNGSAAAKGPVLQGLCGSGAFIGRRAAAAGSRGLGACPSILAGSSHTGGGEDRFPSGAKASDGSMVLQVPDHPIAIALDFGEGLWRRTSAPCATPRWGWTQSWRGHGHPAVAGGRRCCQECSGGVGLENQDFIILTSVQ